MSEINQRVMIAVRAIKQAIEQTGSPGLSVNTHPNPFFIHVSGELDLQKVATLALERVDAHDEQERKVAAQARKEQPAANDPE